MALAIASRLHSAADIPSKNGLNILIYGQSGIGKTTLAASAQDSELGADVLYIDIESGTSSIADRTDITVFVPREWKEMSDIHTFLTEETHTFKTVVIDSITEAQKLGLKQVMGANSVAIPDLADYKRSNDQMVRVIRAFKDLSVTHGFNIIFTALAERVVDKMGFTTVRPALSPKASLDICAVVDIVGYLTTDEEGVKRYLIMHNTASTFGKLRQPRSAEQIPAELEDPSIGKLLDHLRAATAGQRIDVDVERK